MIILHIKQIVTLFWNNCIFFFFLAVVKIEPTPQACKANSVPLSYVLFFFHFLFLHLTYFNIKVSL